MTKRKHASTPQEASKSSSFPDGMLGALHSASHGATRMQVASVLEELQRANLLKEQGNDHAGVLLKKMAKEDNKIALEKTPFGTLVQHWDLGVHGYRCWPFVHPLALLWHLSTISPDFASMVKSMVEKSAQRTLTILIYDDAFMLGNPLRPDQGRNMDGIYRFFIISSVN